MEKIKRTLDGKSLPRHLTMYRDENTGGVELRYWRFQPILLFLIPFMTVWSGFSIFGCYVLPFLKHGTRPMDFVPFICGIPFLVVSVVVWCGILLMSFGTRTLVLAYGQGSYSVKLWGIGRTQRFELRYDTEIECKGTDDHPTFRIHAPIAGNPFVRKIRVKNGYRSEFVCAFWDDDALDFALESLDRHRA